jgi:preprotein translocase subunit SecG
MKTLFMLLLLLSSLFLILLVLVQRGKGGGLAGAFGGSGGQSAFGTKAGDLFTKVTIVVASTWIVLCLLAVGFLKKPTRLTEEPNAPISQSAPADAASTEKAAPVKAASTESKPAESKPTK